jgi:hypothetical protein
MLVAGASLLRMVPKLLFLQLQVMGHFHKLRGVSSQTYRLAFWLSMHKEFQNFSLEDAYANYGIQPLDPCY